MRIRLAVVAAWLPFVAGAPAVARAQPVHAPARAPAEDTTWVSHGAIYEVFVHDFSPAGNFRGVTAGLDRIQAVGANIVWLMPIHPVGILNRKGTLGSPNAVRARSEEHTSELHSHSFISYAV